MTMPKFEPVAWGGTSGVGEWAVSPKQIWKFLTTPLHTPDQLAEAYEAGKREAIPEGYVLVPKEPTEEMLRAPWLNIDELTSFKLKTSHSYYKAMLAAAPKGLK